MHSRAVRNDASGRPRILIFVGTGGVGKTSVAAATALRAAEEGRRSLVLTIDPARRLRTALRIDSTKGQHRVDLGEPGGAGELWAAMVDVRETLDRAVQLYANPTQAQAVLAHPIYRVLISSLAGMQELIAIERLDQAIHEGFDTIVVDTAPSRHALEFLDKPEFFVELVSIPIVKLVGRSYQFWRRTPMSRFGGKWIELYSRIESILGSQLVTQVLDFFSVFQTVAEGYAERATHTCRLLRDPAITEFHVVTSPGKVARDAPFFCDELGRRDFPLGTLIVNRLWPEPPPTSTERGSTLADEAVAWYRDISGSQQHACETAFAELADRLPTRLRIPELPRDIDGLAALREISRHLG